MVFLSLIDRRRPPVPEMMLLSILCDFPWAFCLTVFRLPFVSCRRGLPWGYLSILVLTVLSRENYITELADWSSRGL